MEFKYKPEEIPISSRITKTRTIWRPIIPIIMLYNKTLIGYEALIDSGADCSIFPSDIATILGITLKKGKLVQIYGLGGQKVKGYSHSVKIKPVGLNSFESRIVFSDQLPKDSFGILGQNDFFDHFSIEFNKSKKTITIK